MNKFALLTITIALSLACLSTYFALEQSEFPPTGDILNIMTMLCKYDEPDLFSRDFILSDNAYKLYSPAYMNLVRMVKRITHTDYEKVVQSIMFPIVFVFVCLMTWLLFRITGSRCASLLFAVLSMLPFCKTIFGYIIWSMGFFTTPRFVHMAIAPLLFGLLLFYGDKKWGWLIFLLTGLSANLHFGSGVGLAFIFWLGFILLRRKFNWWLCGLSVLVGVLPFLLNLLSYEYATPSVSPAIYNQAFRFRFMYYPMDAFGGTIFCRYSSPVLIKAFLYFYAVAIFFVRGKLFLLLNAALIALATANEYKIVVLILLLPVFLSYRRRPEFLYLVPGIAFMGIILHLFIVDFVTFFNLYMPRGYYDLGIVLKYIPMILSIYGAIFVAETVSRHFNRPVSEAPAA